MAVARGIRAKKCLGDYGVLQLKEWNLFDTEEEKEFSQDEEIAHGHVHGEGGHQH